MVSVIVLSFNHASYIEKSLKTIINQRTSFNFEILVGDDCSTDDSRLIIDQLSIKFPHLIRVLIPNSNLGANANYLNCFSKARGKYIAFCEGDDYWIDEYKLQKQVDFLEKNLEFGGVCGEIKTFYVEEHKKLSNKLNGKGQISFDDIVKQNKVHSNTTLFRKELIDLELLKPIEGLTIGDWYIHLLVTSKKPYFYMPEYFALYRVHSKGVFSSKSDFFKSYHKSKLIFAFLGLNYASDQKAQLLIQSLRFHVYASLKSANSNNKREIKELLSMLKNYKIIRPNVSLIKGLINLIK